MPRAIVRNGMIVLLDPLPPEWIEGQELVVEPVYQEEADWRRLTAEAFFRDDGEGDSIYDRGSDGPETGGV